jgi:uncharacterized membrane protein
MKFSRCKSQRLGFLSRSYCSGIIFSFLDGLLSVFVRDLFGIEIPGVGALASILLILIIGFVVTNVLGARLIDYTEKLLHKVPIVPKIYFAIKQIIDAFSMQGKHSFSKVAMIEYPRKGIYSIGFIISECRAEIQSAAGKKLINVFIPTTPNPTTGFLVMAPEEDITILDMTVEDGLKLILSVGMV